jgi:hypothetical protein
MHGVIPSSPLTLRTHAFPFVYWPLLCLLLSPLSSSSLCSYSKIYHSDTQVLNQFIKKSLDAYKAVVAKAEAWNAEQAMPEELALCREMIQLLPYKMDRVVAKGGFRV